MRILQPADWPNPRGFSHGVTLDGPGQGIVLAGQTGGDDGVPVWASPEFPSWPNVEAATSAFYPDCSAEDAAWAYARLRHQNSSSLWDSPYPLDSWPPGRRVAIIGADDEAVTPTYAIHVCRTRLGIEPIALPGGHSPFLARPAHLADPLTRSVQTQT